jgi:hypothetical protein
MDIQAIIRTPILITDTTDRITADEVFIGPTGAAFITRVIAIGDNLNRRIFRKLAGTFLTASLLFLMVRRRTYGALQTLFFLLWRRRAYAQRRGTLMRLELAF